MEELVQHVRVAAGEHHVHARRRADDGQLASGGDIVGFPGEHDLVRTGRNGDVRELSDPGERVLADLYRANPDQPDRLAAHQRQADRTRHDPPTQPRGLRILHHADQRVPHSCFHGSPLRLPIRSPHPATGVGAVSAR